MKASDKNCGHGFNYRCENCGCEFHSNGAPHRILLFTYAAKITNHQAEARKLNIVCPVCKSKNVAIDFGKIIN